MKIIAFYLPQFHCIPENDQWWGEGFTEWTNVKNAKPLFSGHNQPRVPLNKNYYNLLNHDTMRWQVDLANKYGIYGFCMYHYWFDGKMLLEKPVDAFLEDKSLKTHYCLCWANEHWTNAWAAKNPKVLIEQKYGGKKEWKEHFEYFLNHFKDERYIKEDNKPLLVIYRPELIDCLKDMMDYWNILAKENGFSGINYAYQHVSYTLSPKCDESLFTYAIEYQPNCAQTFMELDGGSTSLKKIKKQIVIFFEDKLHLDLREAKKKMSPLKHFSYDDIWKFILNMSPRNEKCIPGAFVNWDNTPRRKNAGFVIDGATPKKFKKYLKNQIKRAKNLYKKDMIFVFSWNEWAEGGYLEPDEHDKYGYLEAVKQALDETNEE